MLFSCPEGGLNRITPSNTENITGVLDEGGGADKRRRCRGRMLGAVCVLIMYERVQ